MGVVWKAVDTNLNRDVAIKVLPPAFADDPDRLARFEREARLLASLSHPNIAVIHGLHEAPSPGAPGARVRFLAMEMVEGEDLARRLERGRLPVDEALAVATQIAGALEAAHARGVIHRDLKPANVVLTPEGKAKVLDFGLAKAVEASAAASSSGSRDLSLSPTVTSLGTVAGVILGTAAYMSPEQARGRTLDRRTDLWSFGCVLYECLTGVQLFRGETVSDSLAAILRQDPDWSRLPDDTPPLVRLLVRRCLARDPDRRLQDAGDARLDLEMSREDPRGEALGLVPVEGSGPGRPTGLSRWLPWAVAGAALLVAGIMAVEGLGTAPSPPASPRRLTIPVPGYTEFGDLQASPPAVSPDGRHVVFGITASDGESQLWLRPLDDFEARQLPDTRGAEYAFWSPDSRHVGYFRGGKLRRVEIATGRSQSIGGEGSSYPRGGSWNARGQIIYSPNSNAGIHLIDAAGGEPRILTTIDPDIPDCSHRWPVFLPDGERFLFVLWTNDLQSQEKHGGIYLASLSGTAPPRRILADASSVAYAPPGYLLLVRGDNLIAVPFDAGSASVAGEAAVIATGVLRNKANGHSAFTVSAEGTRVYASGQAFLPADLVWYQRSGKVSPGPLDPAPYTRLRLAPGGRRAATSIPGASGDAEIWIIDLDRGVRTRLTQVTATTDYPIWSGDGEQLLYASQETGSLDVFLRRADGSGDAQQVLVDAVDKILYDWSRDGSLIAYWPMASGSGTPDLHIFSMAAKQSQPLLTGDASYGGARFSPDVRWLTYISDDSGRPEVFVQALERAQDGGVRAGARWQVSTSGGSHPHWRDDGGEITYVDPQGRVMAVSLTEGDGKLVLGAPAELFTVDGMIVDMDATSDHERFLALTRDEVGSEPLHVVLDWPAGI